VPVDSSVKSVEDAFRRSDEAQSADFERLRKYYKLYRAVPDQSNFSIVTRSQYVVPICYKTVETVAPRIIAVLFSASPPIQSRYRSVGDPQLLRHLDALFGWHFDHKGLYWTVQSAVKEALIYGQSYLKVGWKQKKRKRLVKIPKIDDEGNYLEEEGEKVEIVEDGLDVQLVSLFDLYFDPEAYFPDPMGTAKYIIHKSRKRRSQLVAMRDAGVYEDFDEKDLITTSGDQDQKERLLSEIHRDVSYEQDRDDPIVDVYEYWEDEKLVVEAGHRIKLRDEGNPFGLENLAKKKPFIPFVDNLVPGQLWQIGEVEPLEHTQIEASTLRRQRTDVNSLIINPMYLYNKDADVDLEAFELSRPGGGIGCRPIDGSIQNAVQMLDRGDITGGSSQDLGYLDKDGQEISGLLDYAVGSSPERRETATTVQLLQAAANLRFDIKVRNFSDSFRRLGMMMHERWSQLLTEPIPLRIPVPGAMMPMFKGVTRADLPPYSDVDLTVPGNPSFLLKDARHQKLLQHVQTILSIPVANPQAALELEKIALQEAEIDGIEPVLRLLEMGPQMPGMPGMPGQPGMPGDAQAPIGTIPNIPPAPVPQQPMGANENPQFMPSPAPRN
jgi:hypothetical protein